ncbi:hypothetical protein HanXRQr2_Chr06g0239911 [Helianthus annuus]|uniref:Uncharacterized protein n=1 Tax=Helianthus annuus TaxID=4232 RepID=A0A9K3NHK5_HELAN|nr:hypothetical protein HanXRQr2_Chr06g0239911 [Helianthus annuus]
MILNVKRSPIQQLIYCVIIFGILNVYKNVSKLKVLFFIFIVNFRRCPLLLKSTAFLLNCFKILHVTSFGPNSVN